MAKFVFNLEKETPNNFKFTAPADSGILGSLYVQKGKFNVGDEAPASITVSISQTA